MALQRKRVAILVEDDFLDSELLEPLKAMKDAGVQVTIVGPGTKDVFRGKHGAAIRADAAAKDVRGSDFDAVIIPGGYAPDKMRLQPAMINLVKDANQAGRIVAAVCHGPQLLISADIVRGRTATCWPSIAVDLKNAGANYVDKPVVRDGNLITSRKPEDLPQFSAAILDALSGKTSTQTRMNI
ncbi:MAG: type 1 glutamine amidotransferase [Dehalococcoidales bacterium]|nr:type 1 glutamine amidotransferase [Dehalococcoidales bacterium]